MNVAKIFVPIVEPEFRCLMSRSLGHGVLATRCDQDAGSKEVAIQSPKPLT